MRRKFGGGGLGEKRAAHRRREDHHAPGSMVKSADAIEEHNRILEKGPVRRGKRRGKQLDNLRQSSFTNLSPEEEWGGATCGH